MDFISAMRGLVGNTEMMAILSGGPVLVTTRRGAIVDVRNMKPRHYAPKFGDFFSIEWQLQTKEQVLIAIRKAREAAGEDS